MCYICFQPFHPEDRGWIFFLSAGMFTPDYVVSYHRIQSSWYSLMWKYQKHIMTIHYFSGQYASTWLQTKHKIKWRKILAMSWKVCVQQNDKMRGTFPDLQGSTFFFINMYITHHPHKQHSSFSYSSSLAPLDLVSTEI